MAKRIYTPKEYRRRQRVQADARRAIWKEKELCVLCGKEPAYSTKIYTDKSGHRLEMTRRKMKLCFTHIKSGRKAQKVLSKLPPTAPRGGGEERS